MVVVEGEQGRWLSCQVTLACPKPEIENEGKDCTVQIVLEIAIHMILISHAIPAASTTYCDQALLMLSASNAELAMFHKCTWPAQGFVTD
jgi:hypothetical protein